MAQPVFQGCAINQALEQYWLPSPHRLLEAIKLDNLAILEEDLELVPLGHPHPAQRLDVAGIELLHLPRLSGLEGNAFRD